jgi:UDP-glucose 4-epimerase
VAKCLVVGGNGFLGSHLVDALVEHGHEVTAYDRFTRGLPQFESAAVTAVAADFTDRESLSQAVRGHDYVFHFLSATTPASVEQDPVLDIYANLIPSVELFRLCAESGVRRLFLASSGGAIYGGDMRRTASESYRTHPTSPYAIGKLALENYLHYFEATQSLPYTIFRISNPYGPRQSALKRQGLIAIALDRALKGAAVTRFGSGSMVRDYVYVADLIRMIMNAVDKPGEQRVYNLGRGEGHTVNDILDSISRVTGLELAITEAAVPRTFVEYSVLDISRYEREYGKTEYTGLDEGIRRTWMSMRQGAGAAVG